MEFPGDKNGSPVSEGSARAARFPETVYRTVFCLLQTDGLIAQSPETRDPSLQDLLETGDLLFLSDL